MNSNQLRVQNVEAEGAIDRLLPLAEKSITEGRFERASAYAAIAAVYQARIDSNRQQLRWYFG